MDTQPVSLESSIDAAERFFVAGTDIDHSIALEFAGLCVEGRVQTSSIAGSRRFYDVFQSSNNEISFATKDYRTASFDDFELRELQCLMLGLVRLNATVNVEGPLKHKIPGARFLATITEADVTKNLSQAVHPDSCLTFEDLSEISHWFSRMQQDERSSTRDAEFNQVFPSYFMDCLRHRSGIEVLLYRDEAGRLESHRVDAPNPAEDLYARWLDGLSQKPPPSKANTLLRRKRWRLAKLLGSISETRKAEVFNWVSDVKWKMHEYESTSGRTLPPKSLEYYFDDCVIFANDELEFELIKM